MEKEVMKESSYESPEITVCRTCVECGYEGTSGETPTWHVVSEYRDNDLVDY